MKHLAARPRNILSAGICLLCLFAFTACEKQETAQAATPEPVRTPLAETPQTSLDQFWFSGAEINRYELQQSRYGDKHPGHAVLIFVTEPFLPDLQVKNDRGGKPDIMVLKMNALREFNTGIYGYRVMQSVFTPLVAVAPQALKTTLTVQDWCGHVFAQINRRSEAYDIQVRSYFQSEGDQNLLLPHQNVHLEDEFWTLIRMQPSALPLGAISVLPGELYLRLRHRPHQPLAAQASLESVGAHMQYRLEYPEARRTLLIQFERDFPHVIRGWEESVGGDPKTVARLTHREMNSNYWEKNRPQDRPLREKLGLD